MSIRAAVKTGPGRPLELWDIPEPSVEAGGVLLETVASEVCGTDVHLYHGRQAGDGPLGGWAERLLARHRDQLPFARVIGRRYGLEDAGQALADLESLSVTKAIIAPHERATKGPA